MPARSTAARRQQRRTATRDRPGPRARARNRRGARHRPAHLHRPREGALARRLPTARRARPGLAGQIGARTEAHTIRLALTSVLLDRATRIDVEHLEAALALQTCAIRSAVWALQPATGDPLAEQIHAALRRSPDGLTRTQIRDLLHRNTPGRRLDQALANLAAAGKADRQRVLTTGRPAELWTARTP